MTVEELERMQLFHCESIQPSSSDRAPGPSGTEALPFESTATHLSQPPAPPRTHHEYHQLHSSSAASSDITSQLCGVGNKMNATAEAQPFSNTLAQDSSPFRRCSPQPIKQHHETVGAPPGIGRPMTNGIVQDNQRPPFHHGGVTGNISRLNQPSSDQTSGPTNLGGDTERSLRICGPPSGLSQNVAPCVPANTPCMMLNSLPPTRQSNTSHVRPPMRPMQGRVQQPPPPSFQNQQTQQLPQQSHFMQGGAVPPPHSTGGGPLGPEHPGCGATSIHPTSSVIQPHQSSDLPCGQTLPPFRQPLVDINVK